MHDFQYTVALRIRHPSIDPTVLTDKLGFAPQHAWRAGALKAESSDATYHETYWYGTLPSPPVEYLPPDGALMFCVLPLKRDEAFWLAFQAEGGSVRFIVEIFGREDFTLDLSAQTLAMLARLRVSVSVDVHTEMRAVA